jgi:hypothetical protein
MASYAHSFEQSRKISLLLILTLKITRYVHIDEIAGWANAVNAATMVSGTPDAILLATAQALPSVTKRAGMWPE